TAPGDLDRLAAPACGLAPQVRSDTVGLRRDRAPIARQRGSPHPRQRSTWGKIGALDPPADGTRLEANSLPSHPDGSRLDARFWPWFCEVGGRNYRRCLLAFQWLGQVPQLQTRRASLTPDRRHPSYPFLATQKSWPAHRTGRWGD